MSPVPLPLPAFPTVPVRLRLRQHVRILVDLSITTEPTFISDPEVAGSRWPLCGISIVFKNWRYYVHDIF